METYPSSVADATVALVHEVQNAAARAVMWAADRVGDAAEALYRVGERMLDADQRALRGIERATAMRNHPSGLLLLPGPDGNVTFRAAP